VLGWEDELVLGLNASDISGGVPEWLKGTGCKPVSIAYVGSNPTPTTTDSLEGCIATIRNSWVVLAGGLTGEL
jgi:hypothetical protein